MFRRAIKRREIRSDIDIELAQDLFGGPVASRHTTDTGCERYCPSVFCIAPASAFTAGPPSPD